MTYILLAAAGGISDSVIVAVVTGVLSILGIIITNTSANRKIEEISGYGLVHQSVQSTMHLTECIK